MRRYTLEVGGKPFVVDVQEIAADRFSVRVADQTYEVRLSVDEDIAAAAITPEIVPSLGTPPSSPIPTARTAEPSTSPSLPAAPPPSRGATNGQVVGALTAPMPGKILSVEVGIGDRVARSQTLVVLEAMKMKNAIRSPYDGVVLEIKVRPDQTVAHGDLLVQLGEE
jgi:biotin carboxyl carrier protein